MLQTLRKSGGSLVMTVPKAFVEQNGLGEGSQVELQLLGKTITWGDTLLPAQIVTGGDELLAEYARAQPVYVLSERRQSQVPLGRSIYRVDIEDGRLVIGVSR